MKNLFVLGALFLGATTFAQGPTLIKDARITKGNAVSAWKPPMYADTATANSAAANEPGFTINTYNMGGTVKSWLRGWTVPRWYEIGRIAPVADSSVTRGDSIFLVFNETEYLIGLKADSLPVRTYKDLDNENYTVLPTDVFINITTITLATYTITLPTTGISAGHQLTIKHSNGGSTASPIAYLLSPDVHLKNSSPDIQENVIDNIPGCTVYQLIYDGAAWHIASIY